MTSTIHNAICPLVSSCPVINNLSGNDMGVNVLLTGVVHSRIHLPIVPVCGYCSLSLQYCVLSTVGD